MKLKSGTTDQRVYFVLYADTGTNPGTKRMPGVYNTKLDVKYSRDGSAWTTYTTPTIDALDTGAAGVFALTLDEGTTIAAGNFTEEYALHIFDTGNHARDITRVIELYRTDTGNVADAVWAKASRTLTAFALDTGVADTVWKYAGRKVAVDTGIAEQVWKYSTSGATADTGSVGYAQGRLMAVKGDTGAAHLDGGRLGVTANVEQIDGDTGPADNLGKVFTATTTPDANVAKVNDVTVTGVGTAADPWGP